GRKQKSSEPAAMGRFALLRSRLSKLPASGVSDGCADSCQPRTELGQRESVADELGQRAADGYLQLQDEGPHPTRACARWHPVAAPLLPHPAEVGGSVLGGKL